MIQKINVDTVVFDFDGTLARLNINFTEMRNSVMRLIASYGAPAQDFAHLFALEMIDAGRRWISLHGTDGNDFFEKACLLIRDIELAGARKGELVPGVREMLSSLKARGIKTAVVTRNCRDALVVLFPDIDSHVGAVVTRESTPKVKPQPEHLLIALGKISADQRRAAMVGDHPMDIEVGKKLGMFTVGVLTGYYQRTGLEEAGADLVIESAALITDYV
jgi:phosphoglycolate phosphatase